jgi:EpsD family peptidyl-prolyl cis-trans isomerase
LTKHRRAGLPVRWPPFPARILATAFFPFLSACTPHDGQGKITQVAARVNGGEITVHQVNFLLENAPIPATQARTSPGGEAQAALDQLIEQEIVVQAAVGLKLDRNPDVLAALESARRAVLAHAYVEQLRATAAKPSAADIHEYFEKNPALFRERRVYRLHEFRLGPDSAIDTAANDEREAQLRSQWKRSHNLNALLSAAQSTGSRLTITTQVLAAEQLPLDQVAEFQRLAEGAVRFSHQANSIVVQQVVKILREPVSEARASPMIEAYLLEQRARQTVQDDLAQLKKSAQIELIGEFAPREEAARQESTKLRQ